VIWAFPALMGLDAWGAVAAVRRENEGHRRELAAQLATTLPAVALVVATAALWMPSGAGSTRDPSVGDPTPLRLPADRPFATWGAP